MSNEKKFYISVNGTPVEVSEEIYVFYKRSEWREEYYTKKRKSEKIEIDAENETVSVKPSKEDSVERLSDIGREFADTREPMEETITRRILVHQALDKLSLRERFIIDRIFFEGMTERELAKKMKIPQRTLHDAKARILCKLYEILK